MATIQTARFSAYIGNRGKVTFRLQDDEGERVFTVYGNSLGETVYQTPNQTFIPADGQLDLDRFTKPLKPRTARRHFKALTTETDLKQLS